MASEAEASCESDPNFAIICAFMEKFGESCGIPCIDFIELQQMLENNQEVSPELMNLHIKLLRKTKKNVTVERWERALINMCHTFSSKDAWEIERFGYKKTRLPIKLRALKELLEMQFDYNTKFKNEVNKMTAEELRSQPLGRDKLGRAYWFQTDNNYQIRIYKEDPDEETWNLIAKDRNGLLTLITELSDGDSKLSSDSACNEDSNSLLEKPFVDTGQNENPEKKIMEEKVSQNQDEISISSINSNFDLPGEEPKSEFADSSKSVKIKYDSEKKSVIPKQEPVQKSVEKAEEIIEPKKEELTEIRRPMLRIKSLSELMEKPKEPPRTSFLPDLPELTIIKKPKLDLPEITIVKRPRMQQPSRMRPPQVSPAIESPLMIIRGNGSGRENTCGNLTVGKTIVEPILFFNGRGSGRDCETGNERECSEVSEKNEKLINDIQCDDLFISDEIEEPVMYFFGRGAGEECETGNEKDSSEGHKEDEKSKSSGACTLTSSQVDTGETAKQVPTSQLSNIKLGTVIDSKTDSRTFLPRSPNKKSRWDQKETQGSETDEKCENNLSPKKMTFFFGPGSLNVKPSPSLNSNSGELEHEHSERTDVVSDEMPDDTSDTFIEETESDRVPEVNKDNGTQELNEIPTVMESSEETGSKCLDLEDTNITNECNNDSKESITEVPSIEVTENIDIHMEEQKEAPSPLNTHKQPENESVHLESDVENTHFVTEVDTKEEKLQVDCDQNEQKDNLLNECVRSTDEQRLNECVENKEKDKLQNDTYEDTISKKVQNEKKESLNETKVEDSPKEIENLDQMSDDLGHFKDVLNDEETECKSKDRKSTVIEKNLESKEKTEDNYLGLVNSAGDICNAINVEETAETDRNPHCVSNVSSTFSKEITSDLSNEEIGEASKLNILENIKKSEANEHDVVREIENVSESADCLLHKTDSLLNKTDSLLNKTDINKMTDIVENIHQNAIDKTSDNLTNSDEPKHDIETAEPNNESEEVKPSKQEESADSNLDTSLLDNEKLSENQNEVMMDENKSEPNKSEEGKTLGQTESDDNNLKESLLDEKLSENQNKEKIDDQKAENKGESCTVDQFTNTNKITDNDLEVQIDKQGFIKNKESKHQGSTKETETVKRRDKKATKSEVDTVNKITHETADKSLKRGRTADTSSLEGGCSKEIKTIKAPLKDAQKKYPGRLSKAVPEDIPPGKKRRGRKVTTGSKKTITEVISQPVVLTSVRPIRQTRQTRAIIVEAPPLIQPAKGRGRKKASLQATKSDETGSTDSPIPLESVTVNDLDSNSAAVDNTETDPLAVSDDEVGGAQAVSSITSFSFDYDPSSPSGKKNRRKRGRENFENKLEAGETIGKKPKIKGKRTVQSTLRKSVEEKRQKEVGDVSSDDTESVEPITKKETKMKKRGPLKKKAVTPPVSDSDAAQKLNIKKNISKKRNERLLKNLGVREEDISALADSPAPVRQSRRLAQIKIKEDAVTRRKIEEDEVTITRKKKKKEEDKDFKGGKRKRFEEEVKPAPTPPMVEKKKKKKKKQKKISIGWNTSSEDSEYSNKDEEEVSEYEYEEPHEEEPLQFKSDHEFSPESDLEADEQLPHKRARTARKEESDDGDAEEEFLCQKCGKSDHPEWILLCDKCDNGWHCSCLRPALFVIPEGDWYCPTCQHEKLVQKLHEQLVEFDKLLVKKGMEDRRKERLAYVGISLNNVLPAKDKKDKKLHKSSGSSGDGSESESASESADSSDSDEPIYQLRQRRQAHSYKFQDYDDLINSALQEEPPAPVEKSHTLGRGKDIATIVNAAKEDEERNAENNGFEDLPPVVPRDTSDSKKKALSYRKKPKRLNNLEVNSDDEADDSDEDFKGSSSHESEEDDFEEDSEDSFVGRKHSRPVRRSSRARTTRFDADFINDDSDDGAAKKKKKKGLFDDSDSEESDTWGGGKKKSRKIYAHKKPKKKKKRFDDSDLETYRKKKPKIKYGMDNDDDTKARRTRGKRTSYLDTLGSDSEEEALKKKPKDKSDEEYVAEDDDKESEDEFDAEIDKDSEEDKETRVTKSNSESRNSDSDDEGPLVVKKLTIKKKRAILDSEDEDENSAELAEKLNTEDEVDKSGNVHEPQAPNVEEPELHKPDEILPEKNVEIIPEKSDEITPVKTAEIVHEKSEEIRQLEKEALEKPPSVVVPMLNVEKLKACGITLTKVSKEKLDATLNTDDAKSPSNLMEIGIKPLVPSLNPRNNQILAPVTIERIERNMEGFNDEEVEEMMGNEEYANKQLQLASNEIRAKLIKEEFTSTPALDEPKNFVKSPFSIMSNRKLGDNSLKKFRTGRFFNMKPPQEPILGNSSSLGMNNDDNDELSEPPGVTLPLFSEIGPSSIQTLPKPNNTNRVSRNCTPPPMGPNRVIPMGPHNMGPGGPHLPLSNSPYPVGLNSSAGINNHLRLNHPVSPALGPGSISNIPNSTNSIGGPSAPNIPVVVNMPLVHRSNATTPPSSISPDGTPKKRRGRGKGKKTLAAEAAAAAAAAGLPVPEPVVTKTSPNKSLAPNIEISSPPQPFSQSQPAPSVITRMLQNSPGKGAFPVGRIRPKQFAMMPDVDNENEGPRSMEQHGESTHKDVSSNPQRSSHTPGHYSNPVSAQYPPNYYQKEGQGYHLQRPSQPPMHSYPQHPTQTPIEQSSINPPLLNQPPTNQPINQLPMNQPPMNQPPINQSPMNQPPMNQPPINQPPINQPPINQPPINQPPMNQPPMNQPPMNRPPINQPPINASPISQTPINLSETPPPMGQYSSTSSSSKQPYDPMAHRPSYGNSNSGYGYDYNAAAPSVINSDEVLNSSTYENSAAYPEPYENPGPGLDPVIKNVEEEPSGEFGGLVSYFSSQHEDDLDT